MNKYSVERKKPINNLKYAIKIMRITLFFLFFSVLYTQATIGYSQEVELTLELRSTSIKEICDEIEKQSDFRFIFAGNAKSIINREVKLTVDSEEIDKILDDIFSNTQLAYRILDNQIVVYQDKTKNIPNEIETTISKLTTQQKKKQITGKIIDERGEPIIGANIIETGTTNGTITDIDGSFNLSVEENAVIHISYIGYFEQDINTMGDTTFNIILEEDTRALDELIVIGYGIQKKSDLTGSVTRLDAKKYENQQMTQISDLLVGTIAGFNSIQGTSSRGGGSMEIRGRTSLNATDEPLIVLDGVIYNGNIRDISPTDVETIDVLKDASSAAVYGSRAASGVVIITTKKGRKGKPITNFSYTIGISEPTSNEVRPLTGNEYTTFRRDWLRKLRPNQPEYYFHNPNDLPSNISVEEWYNYNSSPNEDITVEWLNRLLFYPTEVQNYINGKEENWYKRVIRTGVKQNYDVNVSGGTDDISYYLSAGYNDNKGLIVGDDFSIFRTRLNLNAKLTHYLDIGINAQMSNQDLSSTPANVNSMLTQSPYGSVYEDNGDLKWAPNDYFALRTPLLDYKLIDQNYKATGLFATIHASLKLPYGFNYKLSFLPNLNYSHQYIFKPSTHPQGLELNGSGSRQESRDYSWMIDHLITWNKTYGSHLFDITLLYNLEKFQSWSSYLASSDYSPTENLGFHALQFGSSLELSSDDTYSTGDALMARLNYSLQDKYLLTLSIRRDGYSAFGQGNPRSTFPAGAFAWKMSEESFFNIPFVDLLKLRASWGVNGNREIGRYAALATLSPRYYSDGSNILIGLTNDRLANPTLSWERTEALNFGVDFNIIGNRINGSIDSYIMTTNQLLMNRTLPRITGFSNITSNLGKIQNRGIELTLNSINLDRNTISWMSNFTFSMNRNKIVSLFGDYEEVEKNGKLVKQEVSDISNQWFINESIDRVWNYNISGVWQMSEIEEAKKYGLTPGDYKAEDIDGDGIYTLDDKQFIGWLEPRFRIGLRNELTFFKNLSVSVFLRGDFGHIAPISDFIHLNNGSYDRVGARSVPYWTPENPSNKYGSITAASSAFAGGYNIYFDRSFLRIQDVTISYQVPKKMFNTNGLRLFTSVRNLYSFNQWESWDPESKSSPMPRTYSFGINLSL